MATARFKTTPTDFLLIIALAKAASKVGKEFNLAGFHYSVLEASMDLEATHASCPLQLREMVEQLNGPYKSDVVHDLLGIRRHLNRETGQLENHFIPRFAAPVQCPHGDPAHVYDAAHDCIECPSCAKPFLKS